MGMGEIVVGLDIGTTKVVALVCNVEDGNIEIIGMGKAPSRGLEKGVVVDIGETTASIKRAIEEAENMADVKIEHVFAGIAGRHINSINNSGTVSISRDSRIIALEDVQRVIDNAQAVQISPDSQLIHVIPRQYIVDGQEGITDPVGMTGTRLEVDVHIVTGSITAVHNIIRCVNNVGIEVDQIVLQPLASSYAVLNEAEKELGVALMDIGGGTTDIAIFRDGDIWFSKILPIAGEHITNDIAVGLKVSYEEADRIKIQEGLPRLTDESAEEERIEITTLAEEKKLISKRKLAKIIEPRLEELFDLAMGEIEDVGYRDLIPAGIVLTGGTSLLKGLPEFVSERYDIAVRRGRNPTGIHGLRDIVESPIYSTVIGLVKYSVVSKEYVHRFGKQRGVRQWGGARLQGDGWKSLFGRLMRWLNRFLRG
ncbi:MAG: cell division protein FtsA [Candidatus Bipolaricaulota bacterium]|nr:cell division protein FtsA [Candidatus Bipolaricaulota bacterium]MDW8140862.1 cell division protein FtsA [Candidatus Bipolaricaulota bacterium]